MILATLEATLNRNIAASSAAKALCARLNGKSLCVHLTGLPMQFTLLAEPMGIQIKPNSEVKADATLTGTPLSLLSLASQDSTAPIQDRAVRIEGNAEVAHAFSELLKTAKPDFEEELSRIIGDVAAHKIGNMARSIVGFGKRAVDTTLQNVGEYLQEEGRDVPTKTEAEEFIRNVDTLRDDAARFEARLSRFEKNHLKNSK
jgi:ubiquinone biosynthesis protein UbiJ